MALNHMLDRMGGMQVRIWSITAKFEKKLTLDQVHGNKATSSSVTSGHVPTTGTNSWSGRMSKSICLEGRLKVGARAKCEKR